MAAEIFDEFNGGGVVEPELVLTQEQTRDALNKFGELSDSVLNSLVSQELPENDFYDKLLESLNSPIFPNKAARVVALYNVLIDAQMPYFEVSGGMKMTNDKYIQIQENQKIEMKKLGHLLSRKFSQKTEQASYVLELIESIDDFGGRVVMISRLIALIDKGHEFGARLASLEARQGRG